MTKDCLPVGIINTLGSLDETLHKYNIDDDVLKRNAEQAATLRGALVSRQDVLDNALLRGTFKNGLVDSGKSSLAQYQYELKSTKAAIKNLGLSLNGMLKPEVYASVKTMAETMTKLARPVEDYQVKQSVLESLSHKAAVTLDTTWLQNKGAWSVEKSALAILDVSKLTEPTSSFSHLCTLEHRTSLLANIPETFTSAVSQIASLTTAIDGELSIRGKYNDLPLTSTVISDYCDFAIRQHELIQKASKPEVVSWRLGILDTVSKYVDRQVDWYLGFTGAIAEEEDTNYEIDFPKTGLTALSLIPIHLGYTRRVEKSPAEGLEESIIVAITEKGKKIADNVLVINKLMLDAGEERIFGLSETVVGGLLNLSTVVCCKEEDLGKVIDFLYFIFYENLKHIKRLVGHGDESIGDQMVRKEDIFQCIFDVKTIRSDLRHDLDHGKPSDVKKKLKNVGNCYKEYCGSRPLKPKDYKKLQERIYDKVIELENNLIQCAASC